MKDVMYTVAKQQVCFIHVAKTMDIVNHPKMEMVSLYYRKNTVSLTGGWQTWHGFTYKEGPPSYKLVFNPH